MIRYRGKKIFSFDKHPLLPNTSSTSSRNETKIPNPLIGRERWYLLLISVVSTVVKRCFSSTMVINTVVKDFDGHGCDLLPRGVLTRWIGRAVLYPVLHRGGNKRNFRGVNPLSPLSPITGRRKIRIEFSTWRLIKAKRKIEAVPILLLPPVCLR